MVGVARSLTSWSGRTSHLSQENPINHAPEQPVTGLFLPPAPEGGHHAAKDAGVTGQRTNKRSHSVACQCLEIPGLLPLCS